MQISEIIYNKHCCHCHLRNQNCNYENCSKEEYEQWQKEAIEIRAKQAQKGRK